MNYTGIMVQADAEAAKLSPEERVRAAVRECEAKHGWKPALVLVHINGHEWPAEIDGVRVVPDLTIPYPTWMLLAAESVDETLERRN